MSAFMRSGFEERLSHSARLFLRYLDCRQELRRAPLKTRPPPVFHGQSVDRVFPMTQRSAPVLREVQFRQIQPYQQIIRVGECAMPLGDLA